MKIIVFSDSHGELNTMLRAVEKEQPELIIHLGDVLSDAKDLHNAYPHIPIECVPGNCDGWSSMSDPQERLTSVGPWSIFYLHGHTARVKMGYENAVGKATAAGADVLLFGHTHMQYKDQRGTMWVINPGSARDGCYAILEEERDAICCKLKVI